MHTGQLWRISSWQVRRGHLERGRLLCVRHLPARQRGLAFVSSAACALFTSCYFYLIWYHVLPTIGRYCVCLRIFIVSVHMYILLGLFFFFKFLSLHCMYFFVITELISCLILLFRLYAFSLKTLDT